MMIVTTMAAAASMMMMKMKDEEGEGEDVADEYDEGVVGGVRGWARNAGRYVLGLIRRGLVPRSV